MIQSMTGFGRGEAANDKYKITLEMKSVNHRFLDISIRLPRKLNFFEAAIRKEVKKYAAQPVIMKLSPNVTDITEMAKAAEAGGADVLSLINTLTGMKIDIKNRRFALANRTGGLSGPAVHPVAVRMVYQTAQAVSLPIIGMGGIATAEDAIEMMLAGAAAVSVGTANFRNPAAAEEILDGMQAYLNEQKIEDINELVGAVC